jgi:hypothetical protein
VGMAMCEECGSGTFALGVGASACVECLAGSFLSSSARAR